MSNACTIHDFLSYIETNKMCSRLVTITTLIYNFKTLLLKNSNRQIKTVLTTLSTFKKKESIKLNNLFYALIFPNNAVISSHYYSYNKSKKKTIN